MGDQNFVISQGDFISVVVSDPVPVSVSVADPVSVGFVGLLGPTGATGAKGDTGAVGPAGTTLWSGLSGVPAALVAGSNVANGYAGLDSAGLVPAGVLPSYVDDVLEYANFAGFPSPGEIGKIYVDKATGKIHRWTGSVYVEISPSPGSTDSVAEGSTNLYYTNARASAAAPVQSVAGRTGAVVVAKADVGLGNVDNTSDASKDAAATALANKTSITSTGAVTGSTLVSTVAQGTAPLTVTSTTVVPNLNATAVGGLVPTISATAYAIGARDASANLTANAFTSTVATGTAPMTVASTTRVNNLNATYLSGNGADVSGTAIYSVPTRDGNANVAARSFISGFTSTVTSATAVTLTSSNATTGNAIQEFTGSTAQTVNLPSASVVAGQKYLILNNSTAAVTIQSSSAATVLTLVAGATAELTALVATPTTAANWKVANGEASRLNGLTDTAASTANTIARRDGNSLLFAKNFVPQFLTTATAAGTTTLLVNSNPIQEFTGTLAQTVVLPTTSVSSGQTYTIINNSTGLVTVQSSAAATIVILAAGTQAMFTALSNNPTTAAHWKSSYAVDPVAAQTLSNKVLTTPTLSGGYATVAYGAGLTYYNTQDQTTNTEYVGTGFTGNTWVFNSQATGTGTRRALQFQSGASLFVDAFNSTSGTVRVTNTTSGVGVAAFGVASTYTNSSGLTYSVLLNPTMSQTGTGGYTALLINPTETSNTGTGSKLLIDAQLAGSSKFSVSNAGTVSVGGTIELGHASDTTLSRSAAGALAVEGNVVETQNFKNVANGYCGLDANGTVAANQLPSYVDDVLEYANLAGFPATGTAGKIFVAIDTGKVYRWSGTVYIEISPSPGSTDGVTEGSTNLYHTTARAAAAAPVQSVAGKTGTVSLVKADVGLGSVDNTSDADKPVSTATSTALSGKEPTITAGTTAQYYRGDKSFQTLDKTAVGLGSVDNTADSSKAVLSATKLATARSINGVSFDGTADIVVSKPRVGTTTSNTAISIDSALYDQFNVLALAANTTITITGTPNDGQKLLVRIKSAAVQTLTFDSAKFQSSGVAVLPAQTVAGKTHLVGFIYDSAVGKFVCVASDSSGY